MLPAITIAAEISRAASQGELQYRSPTAVSICYQHRANLPLEVYDPTPAPDDGCRAALDWLALGKDVLPNARSLSPKERASVNEFFLSHFQ